MFAFAKAETNAAVDWTGTYDTTYGEIILHQRGKDVVGTYGNKGAIRSLTVLGSVLYLEFDNKNSTGYIKVTKTNNGFTGVWGWDNRMAEGNWNGTKKKDAKQHYLKGDWKTNFQSIFFVHSSTGIVAGHYGTNGGKIWGTYNGTHKKLTGKYTTKRGAKVETFSMNFISNTSFKGRYGSTQTGSWNGKRILNTSSTGQSSTTNGNSGSNKKAYLLRISLNSIKFNKSNRLGKKGKHEVQVSSRMLINGSEVPSRNQANKRTANLYDQANSAVWREGDVKTIDNSNVITFHIAQELEQIDDNSSFKNIFFTLESPRKPALIPIPRRSNRNIHLKEVLKFLSGVTKAGDYPLVSGHNGRRRFPHSTDTFWLETIGGEKYIRGYGDILLDNGDLRFGYHYTIELVKND
jgi:hypothetical protein